MKQLNAKKLELLNEIKQALLDKGEIFTYGYAPSLKYKIIIKVEDWHKIFRTDEYNELKK